AERQSGDRWMGSAGAAEHLRVRPRTTVCGRSLAALERSLRTTSDEANAGDGVQLGVVACRSVLAMGEVPEADAADPNDRAERLPGVARESAARLKQAA